MPVNIFTRENPSVNGYEFDAVLEDTLDAAVQLTGYNTEFGVRVADHRVIQPVQWVLVGAVSNNPLTVNATDFLGAATIDVNGNVAAVAGLSAGFLAGSDETRASSALAFLMQLLQTGESFDIDAGDIQLTNMNITRLRRTNDASNEGALIFVAELSELPRLSTALSNNQPLNSQLRDGDPSKTQATATANRGELVGSTPSSTAVQSIQGFT